jgi:prophage regulatory protein
MIESNEPTYLKVPEIQRDLNISRSEAYELVASGRIPHVRIGRLYRVPRQAYKLWLERELVAR